MQYESLDNTLQSTDQETRPLQVVLGELSATIVEVDRLRQLTTDLVAEAREQGATWAEIGDVAGITMKSAHQRWSEKGREAHRQAQRRYSRPTDS